MRKVMGIPLCILLFALSLSADGWCGCEPGSGIQGSKHDLKFDETSTGAAAGCAPCHGNLVDGAAKKPFPFLGAGQSDHGPAIKTAQSKRLAANDPLVGPSRTCLACHDGVITTDSLNPLDGLGREGDPDIRRHHPIGVDYAEISSRRVDLNPPTTEWINCSTKRSIADSLYNGTIITCATCHDIHNNYASAVPDTAPNYYIYTNLENLCLTCHLSS